MILYQGVLKHTPQPCTRDVLTTLKMGPLWFLSNGLMLNPSKAEAIVFDTGTRLWTSASTRPRLRIAGVDIPFVDSVAWRQIG